MLLLWYGFDEDENISVGGVVNIATPLLLRKKIDNESVIILVAQHLAQTFWKEDKKN